MDWKLLQNEEQIINIKEFSKTKPQLIFKHSTRCSISSVAKYRLEQSPPLANIDFYYLDLLKYRQLSNEVADIFSVHHESPQVLLIKNGECIYNESYNSINLDEIVAQVVKHQ